MTEKLNLQPVTPLPVSFDQSESSKIKRQPTVQENAEESANQTYLTFEETSEGKVLYVLRGGGLDLLHQERDKKTLLTLYQERLGFWLERNVRNQIVNVQIGKFHIVDPTYLARCEDFYQTVFLDKKPTGVYLHRMLLADQIETHDHVRDDLSLTLNKRKVRLSMNRGINP